MPKKPSRFSGTGRRIITFEAPDFFKRQLKTLAAEKGVSLKFLMIDTIRKKYPKSFPQPASHYIMHGRFPREDGYVKD